jgi:hypothetical protein
MTPVNLETASDGARTAKYFVYCSVMISRLMANAIERAGTTAAGYCTDVSRSLTPPPGAAIFAGS